MGHRALRTGDIVVPWNARAAGVARGIPLWPKAGNIVGYAPAYQWTCWMMIGTILGGQRHQHHGKTVLAILVLDSGTMKQGWCDAKRLRRIV